MTDPAQQPGADAPTQDCKFPCCDNDCNHCPQGQETDELCCCDICEHDPDTCGHCWTDCESAAPSSPSQQPGGSYYSDNRLALALSLIGVLLSALCIVAGLGMGDAGLSSAFGMSAMCFVLGAITVFWFSRDGKK